MLNICFLCLSEWLVEKQTQPGSKCKVAAAERESEQAQPGGGCYGQKDQ